MSAPQAAAITACTACAAVGGAAAGGAFSSGTVAEEDSTHNHENPTKSLDSTTQEKTPEVINWYPVSNEEDSNKTEISSTDLIGKTYEKYLVGSFGKTAASNEKWWEQSFKKYKLDSENTSSPRDFSGLFEKTKVVSAFKAKDVEGSSTALNQVCLAAYKKNKTDITVTSGSQTPSDQSKLRDDLWRYCSPLGTKPETVESQPTSENYSSGKIGHDKKSFLLSVKDNVNDVLWDLKQKEFFALTTTEDTLFNGLLGEKSKKHNIPNTLKEKCKEVYKLDSNASNDSTGKNAQEVIKHCTLLGTESN